MTAPILTVDERFRRYQRDLEAYRRRSLWRRSHDRFQRDLSVHPHLFLAPGAIRAGKLSGSWDDIAEALRGKAVWTLDTASRLACEIGILSTRDLTGYMSSETFDDAVESSLVEREWSGPIGIAPVMARPALLIAHVAGEPPASFILPRGDEVVTWEALMQDLKGTLGWRPDLLTRLEEAYLRRENG